ncbi:gluconokinase [Enterococcus silesiacus]|uniref:Gluconokinase n=1 Tax=Enterococcus silesiacus TaxID=332949 RepID=A0A0S3KD95_9ENTE|nr:FGGY family carbohydrate kinase [Enterococcus silesiacus]ALS02285.1 gluconokinase [Enterococcus silesiacus]OJG92350.1 hypothetical protein RV15_GL003143 [Enterococcus silesiacus]
MNDGLLAIDIGTTAIKIGIIKQHKLLYQKAYGIKTYNDSDGSNYQLSGEIINVIYLAIKEISPRFLQQVRKISFSVAMHSLMPVTHPLTLHEKIFIWSDSQAEATIEIVKESPLAQKFYLKTGTPNHFMSPFAKLLHFQRQSLYPSTTKWYGLKELVMQVFTGNYLIDYATASATGLLNLSELNWDKEILNYLDIHENQLGELADTTASLPILKDVAENLKLSEETEVVIGASDGCLAAYAGYMATGIPNSLTIGTSAAVRKITSEKRFDANKQNFCYYLNENYYVIGAPSNNGGCVLEWASNILTDDPKTFYETLTAKIQASPIGANGLRFFPYINGERAPFWSTNKRAHFKNFSITHTQADLSRAVVEGVLMNLKILKEMLGDVSEFSLSGGFFKTEMLCEMTANILDAKCWLSAFNEPIFGLYYLIYGSNQVQEVPVKEIISDEKQQVEYNRLFNDYFA